MAAIHDVNCVSVAKSLREYLRTPHTVLPSSGLFPNTRVRRPAGADSRPMQATLWLRGESRTKRAPLQVHLLVLGYPDQQACRHHYSQNAMATC